MHTQAVILSGPLDVALGAATIKSPQRDDLVVKLSHSGISTGTEKLFWLGQMPAFPGSGYPLVPGYESFGEVVEASASSGYRVGEMVFVPGANCFEGNLRGLFGGASQYLVTPAHRVCRLDAGIGAQGALLDIDFGTYPFVTSSNVIAGQAATGTGIGPGAIDYVLGITKAYTTRVGEGPFPTELDDADGQQLGERGHEFGTTTGRKRRCGWFDACLVRQTCATSGVNGISLTKLDVLDGFDELKICVAYDLDGQRLDYLPTAADAQARVIPIYETIEGWSGSTAGARSWAELPAQAIKYVRRIEELIECPVALVSTSPEREDTILVTDPFAD